MIRAACCTRTSRLCSCRCLCGRHQCACVPHRGPVVHLGKALWRGGKGALYGLPRQRSVGLSYFFGWLLSSMPCCLKLPFALVCFSPPRMSGLRHMACSVGIIVRFCMRLSSPRRCTAPAMGGTTMHHGQTQGLCSFPLAVPYGISASRTDTSFFYGGFAAPHRATVPVRWVYHSCDAPAESQFRCQERDRMSVRS